MDEMMEFPEDWHQFLKDYSFKDTKEVYTNGSELIQVFRVEQLINHLSANAVQSITEALQKMFPAVSKADEAFEELGRLALSPRGYRKAVRWDEKNRKRRLKGLPEKPCPYQGSSGPVRQADKE